MFPDTTLLMEGDYRPCACHTDIYL